MIERVGQREDAAPADPAIGRLQSHDPVIGGRPTDRTAGVDVVVSANATGPAPRIDTISTYSTFERPSYTAPYNLTGSPALSVPIGFENGLPLAFQIAGKPFDEAGVMRVGHAFEQATEFHRQRPAIAASLPSQG